MNGEFKPDEKLLLHYPNGQAEPVEFVNYITLYTSMQPQPKKAIVKTASGVRTVPIGDLSRPE